MRLGRIRSLELFTLYKWLLAMISIGVRVAEWLACQTQDLEEADRILGGNRPDADAQTRGQNKAIEDLKKDEPPAKKAKLAKDGTMAVTAKEGKALLGGEKLSDTRQETQKKKSKTPLKKHSTMAQAIEEEIDPKRIDDRCERIPPSWEEHNITFELSLTSLKKEDTSQMVFQLREKYVSYYEAFTDGSKSEKGAAASFYPKDPDYSEQTHLNNDSAEFNSEPWIIWSDLKPKVNAHLEHGDTFNRPAQLWWWTKEIKPRLFAQVVQGGSAPKMPAPCTHINKTHKFGIIPRGQPQCLGLQKEENVKRERSKTPAGRFGNQADILVDEITSIWNMLEGKVPPANLSSSPAPSPV
ncbi:proline-rich receptor-like protein kinase PERK2 isoform X2 [Elysia marginata]|uniref:Proline-rich receptor-like protein kinase PERK2 isoform X2 n=1 Tax=Elysia marginata TaxID=1093978 RepID=A0AAV4HWZ7_9GAST|nr:proline-rich receptor-like protein kinase PERK2 isoform X2 [Elysia marginata]